MKELGQRARGRGLSQTAWGASTVAVMERITARARQSMSSGLDQMGVEGKMGTAARKRCAG